MGDDSDSSTGSTKFWNEVSFRKNTKAGANEPFLSLKIDSTSSDSDDDDDDDNWSTLEYLLRLIDDDTLSDDEYYYEGQGRAYDVYQKDLKVRRGEADFGG